MVDYTGKGAKVIHETVNQCIQVWSKTKVKIYNIEILQEELVKCYTPIFFIFDVLKIIPRYKSRGAISKFSSGVSVMEVLYFYN